MSESNWLLDRMRSDISLLIAQLYGRASTVGAAVKAVEPWKAIVDEINRQQEALQAQSANIQILSGATYTSESYAQSLQSALDRAHA